MKNNRKRLVFSVAMCTLLTASFSRAQQQYKSSIIDDTQNGFSSAIQAGDDWFELTSINENTIESDFGGYPVGDHLFFCSSSRQSGAIYRKDAQTEKPLYNLLRTKGNLSNWEKVKVAEKQKRVHVGSICEGIEEGNVFVTVDNILETNVKNERALKIYSATLNDLDELTNLKELPFNSSDFSTGHPTLSADKKTLYFASDRPGGFGGVDLYKVSIEANGMFGAVVNLGNSINTNGNEMFPWLNEDGLLFFSSNGHGGLGGLDVFMAYQNGNTWKELTNLGTSLNSNSDDFAFVLLDNGKTGYVSSDRVNGKGSDDIYSFELSKSLELKYSIKGIVADKRNETPIQGAVIQVIDSKGELIDEVSTDEYGNYSFDVDPNQFYSLKVDKQDYFQLDESVSTKNMESGMPLEKNLSIEKDPGTSLYALVKDRENDNPIEDVTIKIIDNITGESLGTYITDVNGGVLQSLTGKKMDERISYNFEFSKEGYLSSVQTLNSQIKKEGIINVHELLDISLVKVDKGVDIGKLFNLKPIYFDLGKYDIRPDAALELDKIVKILNDNPDISIELGAHTDSRGSALFNSRLSEKRAISSAEYIKERISNPKRITGKGYGESKLINGCSDGSKCSEEEHSLNRRTEFVIL